MGTKVEVAECERDEALEQIQACEERDAYLHGEVQAVRDKIYILATRVQQDRAETIAKDEHVKVLVEQNNQMLALLESEEEKANGRAQQLQALEVRNKKLAQIAEEFDT